MHGVSFAGSLDLLDANYGNRAAVVSRLVGYVEKQLVEWAEGLPAKLDGVRKGHPVQLAKLLESVYRGLDGYWWVQ